jgi:hypothetical protein
MAPYKRSCLNRSEPRNLFPALYLRKEVCSIQWLPEAFRRRNDTVAQALPLPPTKMGKQ